MYTLISFGCCYGSIKKKKSASWENATIEAIITHV